MALVTLLFSLIINYRSRSQQIAIWYPQEEWESNGTYFVVETMKTNRLLYMLIQKQVHHNGTRQWMKKKI